MKHNNGGREVAADNSTIGVQINDEHWSRKAVIEARRTREFSQMGDKFVQPKHYGSKMVKYHELPILDDRNINNQGIDANGVKLLTNVWYAYDTNGDRIVTGADADNTTGYSTMILAKAAAGVTGTIKSGNGNLYGTSKDMSVQNGSFPILGEEGGIVNQVGMKRLTIEGEITEFGKHITFTQEQLDFDTERNLKNRYVTELGIAQGDLREAQIRNALIGQAEQNRVFAGSATAIGEVGAGDTLTYESLRRMAKSLTDARCPKDTKLNTGSTKTGTIPIGKARYVYVPTEALFTLEDMTHKGINKWEAVETYAAGGMTADGEIGKIGQFRFIEVEDMPNYSGQGADSTDGTNDVDSDNRYISYGSDGKLRYDVFPILFVGSGSFGTIGFQGDTARVQTVMPGTPIPKVDPFGKTGLVSISWYFGMMFLKPEWIRMINCSLTES